MIMGAGKSEIHRACQQLETQVKVDDVVEFEICRAGCNLEIQAEFQCCSLGENFSSRKPLFLLVRL